RGAGRAGGVPREHAAVRRRGAGRGRAQGGRGRPVAPRGAASGRGGARALPGVGCPDASRRMTDAGASAVRPLSLLRAGRFLPAVGVGAIWLFLLLFLVSPLMRILYDAFSDRS